jgi:transcriptional regulator with XRE-family HTH domain
LPAQRHEAAALDWKKAHKRLARVLGDRELAEQLRTPNLDSLGVFIGRLDYAVSDLNRLANVPAEISPLVEASVLQSSFLTLLGCRTGNADLTTDLFTQIWATQASLFGIEAPWTKVVHLKDAATLLRRAGSMPESGDDDLAESLALFNVAVGDYLRKRAGSVQGRAILRRIITSLGFSHDETGRLFGVAGETVRRWEQGISKISDERMALLHTVDAALDRLSRLFVPDRLPSVIRRNAELFDGERALDWIMRGRIAEVADRYDMALSYQA